MTQTNCQEKRVKEKPQEKHRCGDTHIHTHRYYKNTTPENIVYLQKIFKKKEERERQKEKGRKNGRKEGKQQRRKEDNVQKMYHET